MSVKEMIRMHLKSYIQNCVALLAFVNQTLIKPPRLVDYVSLRAPALISFIASLFILVCASPRPGLALSFDDIIDNGEISIAVYRDYPPFSYTENGQLQGVDVEIAKVIASTLGVKLNLMEQTADENVDDDLRNAIWKGHYIGRKVADLMLHVPYDKKLEQRNDQIVLFAPYFREDIVVARDREKLGPDANLAIFRYEKIGVELDTLEDMYLSSAFGGTILKNLLHFTTSYEAAAKLKAGVTAGLMGPRSLVEGGLGAMRSKYDIGKIPTPGLSTDTWILGLAVKNTYRQLGYEVTDIIGAMVSDGRMLSIFDKFGLTYIAPDASFYN